MFTDIVSLTPHTYFIFLQFFYYSEWYHVALQSLQGEPEVHLLEPGKGKKKQPFPALAGELLVSMSSPQQSCFSSSMTLGSSTKDT